MPASAGSILITNKDLRYVISGPVAPREKVTVRNALEGHTVTSGRGGFAVKLTGSGGTTTVTSPVEAGSYPFVCDSQGKMTGTLVVR